MNASSNPRRRLSYIPWICATIFLIVIVVAAQLAPETDFGVANVIIGFSSIIVWLSTVIGCFRNGWRFAGYATLAITAFGVIALLSTYQFNGFDGDLVPQFKQRGTINEAQLPPADSLPDRPSDLTTASSDNDFNQFLGADRDGSISHIALNPDWNTSPPTIAWKRPIGAGWSGFATTGDLAVTIEQHTATEWVTAYDIVTGTLQWKHEVPGRHENVLGGAGPRSTPTIVDGFVYAVSAVSQVVCLNAADGSPVWSADLFDLVGIDQAQFEQLVSWGRSGSPLVVDNRVIVPFGGSGAARALIAFDRLTGDEQWRAIDDGISYSSPMLTELLGQQLVLFYGENALYAISPTDGRIVWSEPWQGSSSGNATVSQPLRVSDNQILLSKGYGTGAKLIELSRTDDQWSTRTMWEDSSILKTKLTSAVLHNGYAYGLSNGILECVDVSNGKRMWKRGRYEHGQVLLVGEHLLITSQAGELVIVDTNPQAFDELASLEVLEGVTWNYPAISGNRVLMRNAEQAACVIVPLAEPQNVPTGESATAQPDNASPPELNQPANDNPDIENLDSSANSPAPTP